MYAYKGLWKLSCDLEAQINGHTES
jgi:hypothetical protein